MATAATIYFPGNLAQVETIAELRDIPSAPLVAESSVLAQGGASFGDGYGGTYVWDSDDLTADNGVSVIKPDDLAPGQAGRWKQIGAGVFASQAAFQQLSTPAGAGLIGYKRPEADALALTAAQVSNSGYISSANFLLGGYNAGDAARFQKMVDQVPLGSTLFIEGGSYQLTSKIEIKQHINIIFSKDAYIAGVFGANITDYLFEVNVVDAANLDNRAMLISGLRAYFNSGGGGIIRIRNIAPNAGNIGVIMEQMQITGPDIGGDPSSATRFAIRVDGETNRAEIRDCPSIMGGIGLFCVDGSKIHNNTYGGNNPFVYLELNTGAFRTSIYDNIGVTRDGFIVASRGSMVDVERNQIEQATSTNTATYRAQIIAIGDGPTNVLRNWRVIGNNFGVGTNVQCAMHLHVYCEDWVIDENTFNYGSTIYDIRLNDATVKWIKIGRNNTLRGIRGGVNPYQWTANVTISGSTATISGLSGYVSIGDTIQGVAANTAIIGPGSGLGGNGTYTVDPPQTVAAPTAITGTNVYGQAQPLNGKDTGRLMVVNDIGTGNYNVFKGATDLGGMQNAWTASADFAFWKDTDDMLCFDGKWTAGTVTAATLIGTLPIGFRPPVARVVMLPTNAPAIAYLDIGTDGTIKVKSVTAAAVLDLAQFRIPIQGHANYTPGI